MRLLVFFSIALLIHTNEGLVITQTDSLKGSVQVILDSNQVIYRNGNIYRSLPASQVRRVEVEQNGAPMIYLSGSFGENKKAYLFEVLSDGKLPLLYREGIRIRQYDDTTFPPYFMKIGISMYSLSDKKQLMKAMSDQKEAIREYMKTYDIDMMRVA
jgi:hypothetical protein